MSGYLYESTWCDKSFGCTFDQTATTLTNTNHCNSNNNVFFFLLIAKHLGQENQVTWFRSFIEILCRTCIQKHALVLDLKRNLNTRSPIWVTCSRSHFIHLANETELCVPVSCLKDRHRSLLVSVAVERSGVTDVGGEKPWIKL